jgi:hypothetical protein
MNWNIMREAIALIAVIGSLIFVGIEVRQNTAATRGQTRQMLTDLNQEWLVLMTTNPDFMDLYGRAWVQHGDVAPEEEARAQIMMVLQLRRQENVFFQFQEGLVDETALASYGLSEMTGDLLDRPRFKAFWSERRSAFHPDFVAFLEAQTARE